MCLAIAATAGAGDDRPRLALVIDDLGVSRERGLALVRLRFPITFALLPDAEHSDELARRAHAAGHQIIAHLPMQPLHGHRRGHRVLGTHLSRYEFIRAVDTALDKIPFASGVNNHMGSLLTAERRYMDWLMETLTRRRGWMFLDSRTSPRTVAARAALEAGIPAASRDVFLDHDRRPRAIRREFSRAMDVALRRGASVAIGHPHDETMAVLRRAQALARERGITLVALREVVSTGDDTLVSAIDARQLSTPRR